MNPLFVVAAAVLLGGNRRRNGRRASGPPQAVGDRRARLERARAGDQRRDARKATKVTARRRGNGRVKQNWTSFPWQPDRVTEVAAELLDKGEADAENLTLAVAKTVYPVHPITGKPFDWPAKSEDVGATMIWERIRLRVNTLVATDEERQADEVTVHASQATAAPDGQDDHAEEEEHDENEPGEDSDDGQPEATSPVIGRMAAPSEPMPVPMAIAPVQRRGLTLSQKRVRRRRSEPQFDPGAYMPDDNRLLDGVLHTVVDRESVDDVAVGVLMARGVEFPSREQVAHYISLIICSPYNIGLQSNWNDEYDLPGAPPYPWGAERPELWLPKLNEEKLATQGMVTTHGVSWSDGSNGITPPPELLHWRESFG